MEQTNMNKEILTQELIKNPAFSSDWVKYAVDIIEITGARYNVDFLKPFHSAQLGVMLEIVKFNADKENEDKIPEDIIFNTCMNETQMTILMNAYKNDNLKEKRNIIDEKLADCDLSYAKMNYAINALADGFDEIIDYIDEYDHNQLYEIIAGYYDGIDYKKYADKSIPSEEMELIRHILVLGKSVEKNEDGQLVVTL